MKSYKQFNKSIQEALDKPYPFRLKKTSLGDIEADFTTADGRDVQVTFQGISDNDFTDVDITFDVDWEMGLTGKGDQFRILATVAKAFDRFMQRKTVQRQIQSVTFSADRTERYGETPTSDNSRVRLYRRFANLIKKKYKFDKVSEVAKNEFVTWFIEKKK